MPPEKPAIDTLIAMVRWARIAEHVRIRESDDGIKVAPEMPSSARAAMSTSALGANAASTEATAKAAAPISRRRRRPIRSPSVPIVIRNPAMRNP